MTAYRGLTWNHPRGTEALRHTAALFSRGSHGDTLVWDSQPLEGFESHPIAELCERYDLVVLDHPHLGDALAAGCLQPIDRFVPAADIADWRNNTVGWSAASYTVDGKLWALPLDAAAQVAAANPELVPVLPRTWDDVKQLAREVPVALSLAGPHALLTFFSLCVALGEPPDPARGLVSTDCGLAALGIMRDITVLGPETADRNPISLLELVAEGTRLAYCPLVYGYATYSARGRVSPVVFGDAPRIVATGLRGSTLGGTGLAVTHRCVPSPALVDHLRRLLSAEAQRGVVTAHHGQPSRREAWTDADVNERYGDFYLRTLATVDSAWVRPRHAGYPRFQSLAARAIRDGLRHGAALRDVLAEVRALSSIPRRT